jgi:EpsD family peptidyl-prolyl cis-trans isomerase
MVKKLLFLSAPIAIVVGISACTEADKTSFSGRFAAKVNGEKISAQQVHDVIAHSSTIAPGQTQQAAAQILERIIDQEVLMQKALEAKLDRDPDVVQAMESARRQVLGQAYVAKAMDAEPKISPEEIRAFYEQHPALFERRRIYRIVELSVVVPPEQLGALQTAAAEATSLSEVAGWLKSRKLPFNAATSSWAAEQIPMNILSRVFEMRDGQITVFSTIRGASVVRLVQAEDAPLGEQQVIPIIERYLLNRKRYEVAKAEVRKLRERAKIEYGGGFESLQLAAAAPPVARARSSPPVAGMTSTQQQQSLPDRGRPAFQLGKQE